ncbi:MAG: TatD family hydrolase [Patescibacteria group bacterium]
MDLKYFDVHSHVSFKDYDADRGAVIQRMREQRVGTITVGVDYETSVEAVAFANQHDGFYATIGLHPTDTTIESFDSEKFSSLAAQPKVVGVGECGLDYFRMEGDFETEKKRQVGDFEKQIAFALEHDLPLMLHCRPTKGSMDAYIDVLELLRGKGARGNVHFFVGDTGIARQFYDLGFTTSFTGVLTFTHDYDEVVRMAPLDMLLTETDSPYVAPVPHRGERNEPSNVLHVVSAIARIRGADEEHIRAQILENTKRVFAI